MGHTLLGALARTRRYRQIVSLVAGGAEAHQIAQAVIDYAERHFNLAANDPLLVETIHTLMQLPIAARSADFVKALNDRGIEVAGAPTANQLVAAMVEAIDRKAGRTTERTDIGEIALMVAAETLCAHLREKTGLLHDLGRPEDVQMALAATYPAKRFGEFARLFLSGVVSRCLNYFLGPVLAEVTGQSARFPTLAAAATYADAIRLHTFEAASVIEVFSGAWYSKSLSPGHHLTRHEVGEYAFGAFQKISSELRAGV